MTVVVVAASGFGVVLGVDGAVEVARLDGTNHLHAGVCKTVTLSNRPPVAVAFFGETSIAGMPWDVALTRFSESLDGPLPSVAEYARQFDLWLHRPEVLGSDQRRRAAQRWERLLLVDWLNQARVDRDQFPGRSDWYYLNAVLRRAEQRFNRIVEATTAARTAAEQRAHVMAAAINPDPWVGTADYDRTRAETVHETMKSTDFAALEPKVHRRIFELLKLCARWRTGDVNLHTGLVFAGFGSEDNLPAVARLDFHGFDGGNILRGEVEPVSLSGVESGLLLHYGKADEIEAFLSGRHPEFDRIANGFLTGLENAATRELPAVLDKFVTDLLAGWLAERADSQEKVLRDVLDGVSPELRDRAVEAVRAQAAGGGPDGIDTWLGQIGKDVEGMASAVLQAYGQGLRRELREDALEALGKRLEPDLGGVSKRELASLTSGLLGLQGLRQDLCPRTERMTTGTADLVVMSRTDGVHNSRSR